jgi:hypothetical protein
MIYELNICVGMFMFYPCTRFYMPICYSLLVIAIKVKASENLSIATSYILHSTKIAP